MLQLFLLMTFLKDLFLFFQALEDKEETGDKENEEGEEEEGENEEEEEYDDEELEEVYCRII